MSSIWIPFLLFAPFFAWLFFFGARRNCPDCGEPLSRFVSPLKKTRRHWVEGGYICGKCDCDVDLVGRKVPAGTAPRLKSLVTHVVFPMLFFVAVVLFSLLLWR